MRRPCTEADLDTLAAALGVSRSAVNHRLRRLVELAATTEDEPTQARTGAVNPAVSPETGR